MDYAMLSDVELLARIVGARAAGRLYKGALAPLFSPAGNSTGRAKLLAARELLRRMLAEEMRRDDVLTHPSAVRDYLRLLFRGQDHESFATLYLDLCAVPSNVWCPCRSQRRRDLSDRFSTLTAGADYL